MPLLTINNLLTNPITFQDPTGLYNLSLTVPASGSVSSKSVTYDQLAAIEAALIAEATAGNITWSTVVDPGNPADALPSHMTIVLVTPYNAVAGDQVIMSNLTTPGAVSVVLSAAAPIGQSVRVMDGKGDGATNNVTVTVASSGTINGGSSAVINTNYGEVLLIKVGTGAWASVASTVISSGAAGGDLTGTYPNPSLAAIFVSAPQALSGAGAANVTTRTTLFTSTGAGQVITLANGSRTGQRKTVTHTVKGASGTGVVTPTTAGNFATATLTNVHDGVELEWSGSAWNVLYATGGTVLA